MAGSSLVHARLAPVVVLLLGFLSNPSLSAQSPPSSRASVRGYGRAARAPRFAPPRPGPWYGGSSLVVRSPAVAGDAGLAPAAPADRVGQQHAPVRSAQSFDLPRAEPCGCSSGSRMGRSSGELHLWQVARLWRLGGERRRCGRRRSDDHEHGRVARTVRLRRPPSHVDQLRVRVPFGSGRRWMSSAGSVSSGPRWRMAARGDHDGDDRPAVHRHAANWRQQRRAQLAESDRVGQARQPDRGSLVQSRRLRRAASQYVRRLGTRHPLRTEHTNFDTSLSKRFSVGGRANAEFRWDVFNLFNHPGFGFPNAAIGNATVGRITTTIVDNRSMQFALKVNF